VRGIPKTIEEIYEIENFNPDEVWVTSLFTYWAKYVREVVQYYKNVFHHSKVVVGGIYASLLPTKEVRKYTGCDHIHQGTIPEAERCFPAYDLIENANPHPIDYQIIHTSRGCRRNCPFCGTWKIEPKFIPQKSIKNEIKYRKVIFYDNNFLHNPYIEIILEELITLKKEKKVSWCECQSGFDGRILLERPCLAKMIKQAGFRYPRIAWDWEYQEHRTIRKQIDSLLNAGYHSKEIYVFMLYNWDILFKEMEMKRIKCWEWKVQITDCRYRPLDQLYDDYNPRKIGQSSNDYYIHGKWTDALIKQFRKNVREQNICVRHSFLFYSRSFERKNIGRGIITKIKDLKRSENKLGFLDRVAEEYWLCNEIRYPS